MSKKNPNPKKSVFFMSPAEVAQNTARAAKLVEDVIQLLPGMSVLDKEDRIHSGGRIREGEADAMSSILGVVEKHPKFFEALADADHGKDPRRVETGPARDDLERREAILTVAKAVEELVTKLNDTLLILGENVRDVTGPAYRIARINAEMNPQLRRDLGTASTFYGAPARDRAREARRAKKATEAPPTP